MLPSTLCSPAATTRPSSEEGEGEELAVAKAVGVSNGLSSVGDKSETERQRKGVAPSERMRERACRSGAAISGVMITMMIIIIMIMIDHHDEH